jgi:hypothetical protein
VKRRVRGSVAAVVGVLLAGCTVGGGDGERGEGASSCAYIALYEGRRYFGHGAADFETGEHLGTAVLPACDDTGGYPDDDPGEPERRVPAYAIKGVDPAVAIAIGPEADGIGADADDSPEGVAVVEGLKSLPPEVRAAVRAVE